MTLFDQIAELKINEAIAHGQLDDLPGRCKPLNLDDDRSVPEEFRMAYRILKNSGFVPPEIEIKGEINALEEALLSINDDFSRNKSLKKLQYLYLRLDNMRDRQINLALQEEYCRKIKDKL